MPGQTPRFSKLLAAGFFLLAVEKPAEAIELGGDVGPAVLLGAGLLLLAVGAVVVARARRTPVAWGACGLLALAVVAVLFLIALHGAAGWSPRGSDDVVLTLAPIAAALGVGGLALVRGSDWVPFAALAAIGQLLLLPLPPPLETTLADLADHMIAHHGVLGFVVQLAVGAVAVRGAC